MTSAEELETGLRYNRLQGILPELQSVVADMQKAVDARAEQALKADSLSPELAKQLWIEKSALRSLLKRFEGRALGVGIE